MGERSAREDFAESVLVVQLTECDETLSVAVEGVNEISRIFIWAGGRAKESGGQRCFVEK